MSSGTFAAATLLPGRRIAGVRVSSDEVRVEVRAHWETTVAALAREVRAATALIVAGHRLHIVIVDVENPQDRGQSGLLAANLEPSIHPSQGAPSR